MEVQAGRIWCEGGTHVEAALKFDTSGWSTNAQAVVDVLDPQGKSLASQTYSLKSTAKKIDVLAGQTGWITWRVTGRGLPGSGAVYELTVTYTATQELKA